MRSQSLITPGDVHGQRARLPDQHEHAHVEAEGPPQRWTGRWECPGAPAGQRHMLHAKNGARTNWHLLAEGSLHATLIATT